MSPTASIASATLLGADGCPVSVEVHATTGLPGFAIVGQPDGVCREARDRVRAATLGSALQWPLLKYTVNLAPSGHRKAGAGLDLAICIGVLVATEQLPPAAVEDIAFVAELGLDGSLRSVEGMVPLADAAGGHVLVVPTSGALEARLVGRHLVRPVADLASLVRALRGEQPWPVPDEPPAPPAPPPPPDLADVRGQPLARQALEVAAAGGHHLLLTGPPGAGKTMLAERLPGILPRLTTAQALEVTRIHSAAGILHPERGLLFDPPYQAPHQTASLVSVVGGGTTALHPGAISCAHNGVLFLDELGEHAASVLESLRQPLEEGVIRISRARGQVSYPARFLLVAATNPCPCGDGLAPGSCRCSEAARLRYARRLSGPLLDRFDLRVIVTKADAGDLLGGRQGEASAKVAERVAAARDRAAERGVACNSRLPAPDLDDVAPLTGGAHRLLEQRLRSGGLSARGLHRVRRVALTLADLDRADVPLSAEHIGLALELRTAAAALRAAS